MKKLAIIMTMIMALGAVTIVVAQKPGRSFDNEKRAEHLKKELNLTDEQQQKLQTMMAGFREEMSTIMEDSSIPREEKREQMTEFREKHQAEMRKILTEEQAVKLEELMANRPMRPKKGDGPGKGERADRHKMIQARAAFDPELTQEEQEVIAEFR